MEKPGGGRPQGPPLRPGARTFYPGLWALDPGLSSPAPVQEVQELFADGALVEDAPDGGGDGQSTRLLDSPHLDAEMPRLDDNHDALRGKLLSEEGRDLLGQALLELGTAGVKLEDPRHLGEPRDLLVRDVGDVRVPVKGDEVVRAQRVERDVLLDDHGGVVLVVGEERDVRFRSFCQATEHLQVHPGHALGGFEEVWIGRIEPKNLEDAAHLRRNRADLLRVFDRGKGDEGPAHAAARVFSRSLPMSRATGISLVTISLIFPSFPTINAVRAEKPLSSRYTQYLRETSPLGWKSASRG